MTNLTPKLVYAGRYDLLNEQGEKIGYVEKRTHRYNIAPRPLTVRYWAVRLTEKTKGWQDFNELQLTERHSTRRDAIAEAEKFLTKETGDA